MELRKLSQVGCAAMDSELSQWTYPTMTPFQCCGQGEIKSLVRGDHNFGGFAVIVGGWQNGSAHNPEGSIAGAVRGKNLGSGRGLRDEWECWHRTHP